MAFISTKVHTVIGLVVGVVLLLAPALFGITDNEAASAVPIWVGAFIILNELITTSPYSPLKLVPMRIHIILDVVTGAFLVLSPWLFSFADMDRPALWVPHLIVGIIVIGYALVTSRSDERASAVIDN